MQRIGEINYNNFGSKMTIVSYRNTIVIIVMLIIGLGSLIGINISLPLGVVTLSGLSLAGVVGIILNAILVKFNK